MHRNIFGMAYLEVIVFLCSMVTFMPSNCETELENSNNNASVPLFLSDLDVSSVEAPIKNEGSLKKIVKRQAPEKNGVTGQPGVDFPALTTIPITSFSCRGLKGGYYADLETNCQVFHICDNGRKISFLCPNGTIFQQSQLICDWWFKVDCSKSAELYEQSSEQLLEEERRRAESRKSKLNYQQSIETADGRQDYYDVQNLNYDGRQNGKVKTYNEPPRENQVQSSRERTKSSRHFDSGNSFSQESEVPRDNGQSYDGNGFPSRHTSNTRQQFNQFTRNTEEGSVDGHSIADHDYHNTPKKAQNYHVASRNSNDHQRDDKGTLKRLKFKSSTKGNSPSTVSQRDTPAYTESTTIRGGNTTPAKESQQVAESAAFVGNRGNRFDENAGDSHQYYYHLYVNRDSSSTRSSNYDSTSWRQESGNDITTRRNDYQSFTTTTSVPYDTTTQYVTSTVTPPCNDDFVTDNSVATNPSIYVDTQPTTDPFPFTNSNQDDFVNYHDNYNDRNIDKVTPVNSNTGTIPATTRSYTTTDTYRQNTVAPSSAYQKFATGHPASTPTAAVRSDHYGRGTEGPTPRHIADNQYGKLQGDSRPSSKNPSTISAGYRQNFISTTTEKPSRTITTVHGQNAVTERDLSPYDRSFTYKQGKVMSTLGPYVPFTRSYAYAVSNATTSRPTLYTPTVPTYTTSYTSPKTLIPKLKYSGPTASSKIKSNAPRLTEREHALSMLHSLRGLESKMASLTSPSMANERVADASAPPAPSTLHSLALYFSTARDHFNGNDTADSSVVVDAMDDAERSTSSARSNGTVQVPSSLLTRNTVKSYVELFKLKDAYDSSNVTTAGRLDNVNNHGEDYNDDDDDNDDLELQQSGGSLDEPRKSNSTRLRELAQVFTHALSAYLMDPDTFKRVLTEIRPTEPPTTTVESDAWKTTTTVYPVTDRDYSSSNGEKDEVLDFSDDVNDIRQKLATDYPSTTFEPPITTIQENVYDTLSTLPSTYYTTPRSYVQDVYESTTSSTSTNSPTNPYLETSVPPTDRTFTDTVYTTDPSRFYGQNNEIGRGNVDVPVTNVYAPSEESQSRVGGFQNNSVTAIVSEPIVDDRRSFVTTPISDNHLSVSSTLSPPPVFAHLAAYDWNKKSPGRQPDQQLIPPLLETHADTVRRNNEGTSTNTENHTGSSLSVHDVRATTIDSSNRHQIPTEHPYKVSRRKSLISDSRKATGVAFPIARTSYTKFKSLHNRVDDRPVHTTERSATTTTRMPETTTTTTNPETTPCTNSDATDSSDSLNRYEETKLTSNDHWTSSPAVTRLWETSVFVDPRRINHGLESDVGTTISADSSTENQEKLDYGSTSSFREDVSGSSEESFAEDEDLADLTLSAQRSSRGKDSPMSFSLLPTSYDAAENTATAKPLITTTITSSVTSVDTSSLDSPTTSLLPSIVVEDQSNRTESEIADRLFGKLNVSSADTLMRVMKQADSNETVRQLVLLLIQRCMDPMNKTMQREKDELLNALLKLPVNEFSTAESKSLVVGINQLGLPASNSAPTSGTVTEPAVTTFRNRQSRRFRTTTEHSANPVRRSEKGSTFEGNDSSREDDTSASDNRALELLRSLYTIATKWG